MTSLSLKYSPKVLYYSFIWKIFLFLHCTWLCLGFYSSWNSNLFQPWRSGLMYEMNLVTQSCLSSFFSLKSLWFSKSLLHFQWFIVAEGVPRCDSFPCSSVRKESACSARDLGSIPGSGRSPGEGNGSPLQRSRLGNPMDRGAWGSPVHGVATSQAQLSN